MCGICGVLGLPEAPGRETINRMLPWIRHRGPDGEGIIAADGGALGHTRLAIRGLESGKQPLSSPDGNQHLVFNGEIYGEEVESVLSRRQCSDSELVFSLLWEHGPGVLEKLEGMFALAYWDSASQSCLLARDRAGEKPLYYVAKKGLLLFASELRAIVAGLGEKPSLDKKALEHYLVLGYLPSPETIVQGIRQLPPGYRLLWQNGSIREEKPYWSIFDLRAEVGPTREGNPDIFLKCLQGAVRSRLAADTSVGLLLSGGVDSSAVAAMASGSFGRKLDCFSQGFDDPGYDELEYAEMVASRLGLQYNWDRLESGDIFKLSERALGAMDGPMGDPSWFPTFALAGMASSKVKVALGGDGADELFGGYQAFAFEPLAAFFDRHRWLPIGPPARCIARNSPGHGYRTPRYAIHQFLKGLSQPTFRRHILWLGAFAPPDLDDLLLMHPEDSEDFWSFLPGQGQGSVDLLPALYFRYYLGDCLLVKTDRASMAHGLEIRSPFLDSKIISFAMQLPMREKVKGRQTKFFLKQALRGIVPEEILKRPKQGFAPPISEWFRGPLRADLEASLDSLCNRRGLMNESVLRRILAEHLSGKWDHRRKLWVLHALDRGMKNLEEVCG